MKCSKCASKCCAIYVLDDFDWNEISNNMKTTTQELTKKYPNRTHKLGPVNFCIFCDLKSLKCSIYEYRPDICSKYFCNDWEVE